MQKWSDSLWGIRKRYESIVWIWEMFNWSHNLISNLEGGSVKVTGEGENGL